MVWKTNFNAADYGEVLKSHKSGADVDETHHILVGQQSQIA